MILGMNTDENYFSMDMEAEENYVSLYSFLKSVIATMLGMTCTAVIFKTYRHLKKGKRLNSINPPMPGPKVPIYNIMGIWRYLPSNSVLKKLSLPPTAFVDQIILGCVTMFPNEKLIRSRVAFRDIILLTKAESIEEFVSRNVLVRKPYIEVLASLFGPGLFTSFGDRWKARKKLLMPMFHYDVLKECIPKFDEESKILTDILKRSQEKWIDILKPLGLCTMDIICGIFLGTNLGAQKNNDSGFADAMTRCTHAIVKRVLNPLLHFDTLYNLTAQGKQFKEDIHYVRTFAEEVIRKRIEATELQRGSIEVSDETKTRKVDLLDLILDLPKTTPSCTVEEMRDELLSLIFAGQDTTSSGLCFALYLIGLNPKIQSKIHEELDGIFGNDYDRSVTEEDLKEMSYIECVLKESQRIYPTSPLNPKIIMGDIHLCGYKIKKGSMIVLHPLTLHRNPEVFPNPEIFDPDNFLPENCVGRSPFAYIPFSTGIRTCIGRRFAMMEEKTVLANILRKLSVKSLDHRDKIIPTSEITVHLPHPLKLKFTPRVI